MLQNMETKKAEQNMTNMSYELSENDTQLILKDYQNMKHDNQVVISKGPKNIDNIFSFNKN